ncbi:hypothetical protein GCM10027568_09460 [Humibacter soli]
MRDVPTREPASPRLHRSIAEPAEAVERWDGGGEAIASASDSSSVDGGDRERLAVQAAFERSGIHDGSGGGGRHDVQHSPGSRYRAVGIHDVAALKAFPGRAETSAPSPEAVSNEEQSVTLRVVDDLTGIETINLVLVTVDGDLDEVRNDGGTIGYIRHVGRLFVALHGSRRDRAEECGQFSLWDHAAQSLVGFA